MARYSLYVFFAGEFSTETSKVTVAQKTCFAS